MKHYPESASEIGKRLRNPGSAPENYEIFMHTV